MKVAITFDKVEIPIFEENIEIMRDIVKTAEEKTRKNRRQGRRPKGGGARSVGEGEEEG
jgi:hypothetical protein